VFNGIFTDQCSLCGQKIAGAEADIKFILMVNQKLNANVGNIRNTGDEQYLSAKKL